MPRRSQAQEDAVRKAGKVSGERRRAAAKRKRDTELREGWERVSPAVEVVAMRSGPPYIVGKFYIVTKAASARSSSSWPQLVAGPFDNASEAVEHRTPGTNVARECA